MMAPPAYRNPVEVEECCDRSKEWSTAPPIVKEMEWERTFIDWCTEHELTWYAEAAPAPRPVTLNKLIETWRDETQNVSSLTLTTSHQAYQEIINRGISMGRPVIAAVLVDFQKHGGYWAVALRAITGENPVAVEHLGNPKKVREDWLKWGKSHGYI
jgi:hypothetical protein